MFLSIGMLKQKYFLTDIFILSAEKQPIKLSWRKIECLPEQRTLIKGKYPYFGAMSIIDYIDDYIFDGVYLLFAEDGVNVVDEDGHPNLQYVYGKFWLNNHAHIMQGNDIVSTEYLYLALQRIYSNPLGYRCSST